MQTFYHLVLVLHIIGLTMMAGATLTDYVVFRQFWKYFSIDQQKAFTIREAVSKVPVVIRIGAALLILSGITMMALTKGVFGEQIWFRIKFALVLVVIANALLVGRRQGIRLNSILAAGATGNDAVAKLAGIKNNINVFHLSQLACFTTIFVLSVFRFN